MQVFTDMSGFLSQNELLVALLLVFASVAFLIMGGVWALNGRGAVQRR